MLETHKISTWHRLCRMPAPAGTQGSPSSILKPFLFFLTRRKNASIPSAHLQRRSLVQRGANTRTPGTPPAPEHCPLEQLCWVVPQHCSDKRKSRSDLGTNVRKGSFDLRQWRVLAALSKCQHKRLELSSLRDGSQNLGDAELLFQPSI